MTERENILIDALISAGHIAEQARTAMEKFKVENAELRHRAEVAERVVREFAAQYGTEVEEMTDYERLTERDEFGNADIIGVDSEILASALDFDELNKLTFALNQFAKLEDKIERGELVEVPKGAVVLTPEEKKQAVKEFAESVKMAFYYEFDELIPSRMADKIDELVKEICGDD